MVLLVTDGIDKALARAKKAAGSVQGFSAARTGIGDRACIDWPVKRGWKVRCNKTSQGLLWALTVAIGAADCQAVTSDTYAVTATAPLSCRTRK